ncbi:piggyBac transposable element-derived protein 4 [Trichonephila clavipes]|uniref:PiggyBac transposable element-derived protein 4 n=1 Tax=Trichonephila clavipes TaxID=2585209 RepID=A0A8X6WAZ9_TRICX|nr:piggyBac transposable element-derived protein 4 [Trichonephila clavipes]
MYMLCEAKSGYVWSSIIFTGRGTLFDEEFLKPEFSKSMQVVLTLMKPLLNKGYCVTLDNYYSSPILTDILVKYKTDSYGTINLNRKEVPSYVKSKKLKKGETVAFRREKALILKWKDKKDVSLISTIHNSEMIAVRSSRKEKLKPKIVVDYNDTMGGVDRADQNLASYAIPRKHGEKYYRKIFFHIFNQCIWNSYVLYKKIGGSKSQLQFRLDLVNEMVIKYHSESMGSKRGRPLLKTPLQLTERHFVKFIPPTEKREKPARKCFICCRKRDRDGKKIRKETRYYCEKCDVGLCAVPCFEKFHTQCDIY